MSETKDSFDEAFHGIFEKPLNVKKDEHKSVWCSHKSCTNPASSACPIHSHIFWCDSNEDHFLSCIICDGINTTTKCDDIEKLLQTPIKGHNSQKPMSFANEYTKSPIINEVIRSLLPKKFKHEDIESFFSKLPAENPEKDNDNHNFAHRGKIKQITEAIYQEEVKKFEEQDENTNEKLKSRFLLMQTTKQGGKMVEFLARLRILALVKVLCTRIRREKNLDTETTLGAKALKDYKIKEKFGISIPYFQKLARINAQEDLIQNRCRNYGVDYTHLSINDLAKAGKKQIDVGFFLAHKNPLHVPQKTDQNKLQIPEGVQEYVDVNMYKIFKSLKNILPINFFCSLANRSISNIKRASLLAGDQESRYYNLIQTPHFVEIPRAEKAKIKRKKKQRNEMLPPLELEEKIKEKKKKPKKKKENSKVKGEEKKEDEKKEISKKDLHEIYRKNLPFAMNPLIFGTKSRLFPHKSNAANKDEGKLKKKKKMAAKRPFFRNKSRPQKVAMHDSVEAPRKREENIPQKRKSGLESPIPAKKIKLNHPFDSDECMSEFDTV